MLGLSVAAPGRGDRGHEHGQGNRKAAHGNLSRRPPSGPPPVRPVRDGASALLDEIVAPISRNRPSATRSFGTVQAAEASAPPPTGEGRQFARNLNGSVRDEVRRSLAGDDRGRLEIEGFSSWRPRRDRACRGSTQKIVGL